MSDIKSSTTAVMTQDVERGLTSPNVTGLLRLHPWHLDHVADAIPVTRPIRVGRDESCSLTIQESSVSREHALIRPMGAALQIEERGSRNGTFIEDRRLEGVGTARRGDLVRFGRCTFLVVEAIGRYAGWWSSGREGPIFGGPAMGEVRQLVRHFGAMPNAVLITGESGTGKEVVANALHSASIRSGAMVSVNCAAVPESVFEAQFFGHVKGAFTGATRDEPGFLRAARGGTLFLDEVGELAQGSQAKLLRALESSEIVPIGASHPVQIDVRVIAATNRDLAAAVESGDFRSDLYTRLRVLSIPLPPLRDRLEDVVLLCERFLSELPTRELRYDAVSALCRYSWPGNVRELKNALVEASALAVMHEASAVEVQHLRPELADVPTEQAEATPRDVRPVRAAQPVRESSKQEDQEETSDTGATTDRTTAVIECMHRHGGNVSQAAKELGLHRQQVYNVLYRLGKKPEDFRVT